MYVNAFLKDRARSLDSNDAIYKTILTENLKSINCHFICGARIQQGNNQCVYTYELYIYSTHICFSI